MSNDLISREKLIDSLNLCGCYKHENPKAYDTLMLYEILGAIEDQPTAYDVEKVVEEINEESWEYMSDFPNSSVIGRDDAIDIVKRGGVI